MSHRRHGFQVLVPALVAVVLAGSAQAQRPSRSQEMASQAEAAVESKTAKSVDAEDAQGSMRYTIQVVKFEDESGWSPHNASWRLTTAWSEMLTAKLAEDGHFIVIAERDMRSESHMEQNFGEGEWVKEGSALAPKKANMTPAQLIVKGTITGAKQNSGGGDSSVRFKDRIVNLNSKHSSVMMIVQVVDAQTGQLLAAKQVEGKAGKSSLNIGNLFPSLPSLSKYGDEPMVKACYDALGKAVETCVEALPKIQWRGSIVDVPAGDLAYINRGNREGVKAGRVFCFGPGKQLTDPDTGESLGFRFTEVGRLEVVEVEEKLSLGKIISGGQPTTEMMVWLPKK